MWLLARKDRIDRAVLVVAAVLMIAAVAGFVVAGNMPRPDNEGVMKTAIILMMASGGVGLAYTAFCLLWSVYLTILLGIARYRSAIRVRWV